MSIQSIHILQHILSYQLKLKKMRTKLASPNRCAVPFLSRAAVNLSWYDSIYITLTAFIR